MSIVRLRLKHRSVPKEFPFQVAYLVPATRRDEIYRLFGPAFSVPYGKRSETALGMYAFEYVNRQYTGGAPTALTRVAGEHYVVVPLQHAPNSAQLKPFSSKRSEPTSESYRETAKGGSERWRTFRKELAQYLSAEECMLHLGPNKEDTQHICTHCPNTLSHMLGHCTPGESVCTKYLVVPVDALLRLPAGRPRRAAHEGR